MQKKKQKITYHKKPDNLSTAEWQRELRKQFIQEKGLSFIIKRQDGEHPVFTDYTVENPASGGVYKVALRSKGLGLNFCTCMDFKTNMLGTCKHIEVVIHQISQNKKITKLLAKGFTPSYSSLFLKYGNKREIMMRIGTHHRETYKELARRYFDSYYHFLPDAYDRFEHFLQGATRISADFRCYQDALDFIIMVRESRTRNNHIQKKIGNSSSNYFDHLLKTNLYPYQKEGIIFAVKAGRCLIADDMGLGKTIEALGTTELFKKEFNIHNVLIICPTSLKYQWKSEIEKFTHSSAKVIEGNYLLRQKQYRKDSFYKIISYNVVGADIEEIKKLEPDLIILDEAQRIKNWKTKTAQIVKKIESEYTIVLTGTPIENKLEELYSIIQYIDPYKLGPLYKFLEEHQIHDQHGKVIGYQKLHQIRTLLSDIIIRRTRKEVLTQLPSRTDKHLFVPLTKEQTEIHSEYADLVARLVHKWKRFGFLDEKDRQRLLLALNCMRMVSDSTYILDQKTRYDTKITELMYILDDVFVTDEQKVVVFSQWERMTRLVRAELENRKITYAYLHGGIPSNKRKWLLDDFKQNQKCRVFLSTDAGGIGLNLQSASLVVNLDIPWNPAVLEQRIGRIHRHGQKRNVNVINLISRQSIEERMLDMLKFKSSLFAGVLDDGENQIFMGESRFKRFMRSVEQVAVTPEPVSIPTTDEEIEQPPLFTPSPATEFFTAAESFFGTLAKTFADKQATEKLVSSLIQKDENTGKQYLKIPLENKEVINKAVDALTGLLSALK